jgi:nitrogen-specific signal transduction histidine kinase
MRERERLAALGEMAAGLAHEIRNPLGAIKGAAQLLAEPEPGRSVDESSREFLGIILEEVERLDKVVGSVLDLSRQSSHSEAPIDVNPVVRRTVPVMSTEWADLDFRIDMALVEDLLARHDVTRHVPVIHGDALGADILELLLGEVR